jgi:hypothetical protein
LYNFKHVATPARYFSKAGDTVPFYSRIWSNLMPVAASRFSSQRVLLLILLPLGL